MSQDGFTFEPLLSYSITLAQVGSFVSSPVQRLRCAHRVSESKSITGALLASSLFLRFLVSCLILWRLWRRGGNWLPWDWVVEAGWWVEFVIGT